MTYQVKTLFLSTSTEEGGGRGVIAGTAHPDKAEALCTAVSGTAGARSLPLLLQPVATP